MEFVQPTTLKSELVARCAEVTRYASVRNLGTVLLVALGVLRLLPK